MTGRFWPVICRLEKEIEEMTSIMPNTQSQMMGRLNPALAIGEPFTVKYRDDIPGGHFYEFSLLDEKAAAELRAHPSYKQTVECWLVLPMLVRLLDSHVSFSVVSSQERWLDIIVNFTDQEALDKAVVPCLETYQLVVQGRTYIVTLCGQHAHTEMINGAHEQMDRVGESSLPFCLHCLAEATGNQLYPAPALVEALVGYIGSSSTPATFQHVLETMVHRLHL